jgi:signal peptidase I
VRQLRFVLGLASLATVTLLAALVVLAALLPTVLGLDRVVLVSGSMTPSAVVGDVILVDPDLDRPARPGNVITFSDPSRPGGLVTHRVVRTYPDGSYQTKGDANTVPDSTPVTPEMVQGRGKLLVPLVGYPSAMLQEGAPGRAVLVLVGIGILVGLSRYGLLARYDPWAAPAPRPAAASAPRRSSRRLAVLTATSVAVLAAVVLTPQVTRASYTDPTNNAASYLQRAAGTSWFLNTFGTGDRVSTPILGMSLPYPSQTTLPNYDTNRNTSPGLTIARGTGLNETDPAKVQRWAFLASSSLTLSGTARLTMWTAMPGFSTTKAGTVEARLYDCNGSMSNCTAFGNAATVTGTPWSTVTGGWTSKTWDFGPVNRTINANRVLEVRVAVTTASADDIMFAYDTTAHPSSLLVG